MATYKILKTNVVDDYVAFVDALDYKFDFEDREAFEEDFVDLVKDINVDTTYDAGKIIDGFLIILTKHSKNKDLKENAQLAVEELKALGNLNG